MQYIKIDYKFIFVLFSLFLFFNYPITTFAQTTQSDNRSNAKYTYAILCGETVSSLNLQNVQDINNTWNVVLRLKKEAGKTYIFYGFGGINSVPIISKINDSTDGLMRSLEYFYDFWGLRLIITSAYRNGKMINRWGTLMQSVEGVSSSGTTSNISAPALTIEATDPSISEGYIATSYKWNGINDIVKEREWKVKSTLKNFETSTIVKLLCTESSEIKQQDLTSFKNSKFFKDLQGPDINEKKVIKLNISSTNSKSSIEYTCTPQIK
jgi:hypothetical protein